MSRSGLSEFLAGHRYLLLTLVVALAVRLGLAVAVQERVDRPPAKLCLIPGDAEGYWDLAQNLVAGRDYAIYDPPRHVLRTPGFPLLLAASQLLFGPNPFAARCLLAFLGAATCGLTYWLGKELVDSDAGLIAAMYTAISPTLSLFSVLILSETAFAAALLLSLIAICRLSRNAGTGAVRQVRAGVWVGVLIGVATLFRPTWLYVGTAIAMAAIAVKSSAVSWRLRSLSAVAVLGGVVISLAPWTIRNYQVTGHFVPTTLWVGPSLYDGLNPDATGDSNMQFFETDQLMQRMSEYEMDREYRRRSWGFALANPGRAAWLAIKKQQRYWSLLPNADQFRQPVLQVVALVTSLPLLLFAAWGCWIYRGDARVLALAVGPVLLFAALHLLFVGSLRYRLPAEYPLAVIAAAAVQKFKLFRSGGCQPPGILLVPSSERGA